MRLLCPIVQLSNWNIQNHNLSLTVVFLVHSSMGLTGKSCSVLFYLRNPIHKLSAKPKRHASLAAQAQAVSDKFQISFR